MTGMITDIQRFSLSDGDGIRTMVFFKGCPLRCEWCHNPETHQFGSQLMYHQRQCRGCLACVRVCPLGLDPREYNKNCVLCGVCAEHCYSGALKLCGYSVSEEVLQAILFRDRPFYEKSGGVTFSGGEPLAQPQFLFCMLQLCHKAGINTAIETCGYAPEEIMTGAAALADCILFDIKTMDTEKHRRFTGAGNELILSNLAGLLSGGTRVRLRLPIVPGYNDTIGDALMLIEFLRAYPRPEQVELLAYHDLGREKYPALHLPYPAEGTAIPDTSILLAYQGMLTDAGIPCVIK